MGDLLQGMYTTVGPAGTGNAYPFSGQVRQSVGKGFLDGGLIGLNLPPAVIGAHILQFNPEFPGSAISIIFLHQLNDTQLGMVFICQIGEIVLELGFNNRPYNQEIVHVWTLKMAFDSA